MLFKKIERKEHEIIHSLAVCIGQIHNHFKELENACSPELIKVISVLESNQNDFGFSDEEANAIGKYFRDKGYDKKTMQFMVERIMSYWN